MKNIVTADWLIKNIDTDNLVVIDCRFELGDPAYGKRAYEKSHINGAFFMDIETDMSGEKKENGGRHPLPALDTFQKKLQSLGISDDTTVVIYDNGDLAAASRLWWMMKYIDKNSVYVLEGGFNNWSNLGYEVSSEAPKAPQMGKLTINIKSEMLCDVNYVRSSLGKGDTAIVDSRAEERYRGLVEPLDKRAGHIPGSLNYFWQENFEDFKLKGTDSLKKRFDSLKNYKEIIVHCGSGITACPNILAMDEIGMKPTLYLGGWSDWVSYEDNDVVTED